MNRTVTRIIHDGWVNILTGLGVLNKDKRTGARIEFATLKEVEVEALYAGDDVARKYVNIIPCESFRKGYEIVGLDEKILSNLTDTIKKLQINEKFLLAFTWARMYGGSAILIGVSDGEEDLSEPLNITSIKEINSLTVLHRWELQTNSTTIEKDISNPNFGLPNLYQLQSNRANVDQSQVNIHHTRLIRFDGALLPTRLFEQNEYWHDSILTAFFNPLRNFNLAHDTLPNIIQEFGQGILKMKDVADLLAAGKETDVINRLAAFDLGKTAYKTAVIDETEDYQQISKTLTGLKDTMSEINRRLVVSTNMPHTIILGDSPTGGLNGKGVSEKGDFFDLIASQQNTILRPRLERIINLIFLQQQGPAGGLIPDNWNISFIPLKEMDRKEEAEIHKIQAESDKIYLENAVLGPDEVALSRFSQPTFSVQTEIDVKVREDDKKTININNPDDKKENK